MSGHPELESEQEYFDATYEWRERRSQSLPNLGDAATDPKALADLKHAQEWLEVEGDPPQWPADLPADLVDRVASGLVRRATQLTRTALRADLADTFRARVHDRAESAAHP